MSYRCVAGTLAALIVSEYAATNAGAMGPRISWESRMANEADAPAKLVEVPNENAGGRYVNKFGYGNESASSLPLLSRPLSEDFAGAAADPQITPTSGPAQKRKSRSKHVLKLVLITLVVFVGITFAVVLLDRKD